MTLSGSDIADTIKAVQDYLQVTKRAHPVLLDALMQEAASWHSDLQSLRNAGDQAVDAFFRPSAPDEELGENLLIANLRSYARILQFDAYRERLNGNKDSHAQQLLERMEPFLHKLYDNGLDKGFTEFGKQVLNYIKNTSRHPSEAYLEPLDLKVDYSSAIANAYDLYANWFPSDNMQTVTGTFPVYGNNQEYKSYDLACKKEQLEWAFEREGLPAKVEVKLGKTYGEDAVSVTINMQDYTQRYIPGILEISPQQHQQRRHRGYAPGKDAFLDEFASKGVVVSAALVDTLSTNADSPASDTLRALRANKYVTESKEDIPVASGKKRSFVRFGKAKNIPPANEREIVQLFVDIDEAINAMQRKHTLAVAPPAQYSPEVYYNSYALESPERDRYVLESGWEVEGYTKKEQFDLQLTEVNAANYPKLYEALVDECEFRNIRKPKCYIDSNPRPRFLTGGAIPNINAIVINEKVYNEYTKQELRSLLAHEVKHLYQGEAKTSADKRKYELDSDRAAVSSTDYKTVRSEMHKGIAMLIENKVPFKALRKPIQAFHERFPNAIAEGMFIRVDKEHPSFAARMKHAREYEKQLKEDGFNR